MGLWNSLKKEIRTHKAIYLLLAVILIGGFFVRVYRINDLLGFYYDQGRDALVIWDLWHEGEFFLIGPTTGIEGIFRGPWYYWLIAPFYLIAGGNPVWPSVFLSFTTVLAIFFLYKIGEIIGGRITGIIAAIVASFSYTLVLASRWLSNPTPMLLISILLVYSMIMVTKGKKLYWIAVCFLAGMAMQFGSAAEIFYFPAILVFALLNKKHLPDKKIFLISLTALVITFAPQIVFDIKHEGILKNNFIQTFGKEKSFIFPTHYLLENRSKFYYEVFPKVIFHSRDKKVMATLGVIALGFLIFLPKLIKNKELRILLVVFLSPIFGLYFYQGNDTVLYEYYMTGYYLIFVLLVAVVLGIIWKNNFGKVFVFYFLLLFLLNNIGPIKFILSDDLTGEASIALKNQKEAIDWIYLDAKDRDFNVDVYVPPVIPYAYDYLFRWYGGKIRGREPADERVDLLYTLYEVDSPHPERLEAWLNRQKGIGKIEDEVKFGGISVQRRTRL